LGSLRAVAFDGDWELIIVDNGSTDDTAIIVQNFINSESIKAKYVFEPRPGLANAHNGGLAMAQGDIVAFTDDDCYPAPDFLTRVYSVFETDSSLGYITGRIMLHDPADFAITVNESPSPLFLPGGAFLRAGIVQGANMAFRRSVLQEIGGFDPLFGPGSMFNAEDTDAAARACAKGWSGRYCPEAIVRHHHRRKASDVGRLWKSYGIGIGAYHMKLLLNERQFRWFFQCVCQVAYRYRMSGREVLWEPIGALKYCLVWLASATSRQADWARQAARRRFASGGE
jgi:cellulose synthase/poly-beta-1,6-N-acetylglucosamine synthase-like glycosyltransferase